MSHFPIGCETVIATQSFHLVRFSGGWRSARLDLAPGTFSPKLGVAEKELNEPLDAIPGIRVERKRFSIAVHYRHGDEIGVATVRQASNESARATASCAFIAGKKVYELLPRIEWDKGKAVMWLLEALGAGT
jgi:trehalose-phosphatase